MRRIRPFVEADIPRIADLYHRTFLQHHPVLHVYTPQQVIPDFTEIFFRNPWRDAGLESLVCESADGTLQGFLGMTARRLTFKGRTITAAISVHHMVEQTPEARLAGMQMLKAYFEGPQDLSLTDGANELGKKVWEGFGGSTAWVQCFEWTRVLQPGSYGLSGLGNRFQNMRALTEAAKPLGRLADRVLPRYFHPAAVETTDSTLDAASLLTLYRQVTSRIALKPDYDERSLAWLLARAAGMTSEGTLQTVAVHTPQGKAIGWYVYYLAPGRICQVLQIAAERGSTGAVLDHLFMHAATRGAAALTGRVEPGLMDALGERERKVHFRVAPYSKVLVHSRHPELLKAIYDGDAFLTKLEGEWCTSFRM